MLLKSKVQVEFLRILEPSLSGVGTWNMEKSIQQQLKPHPVFIGGFRDLTLLSFRRFALIFNRLLF